MHRLLGLCKYNRILYNVYNKWATATYININKEYNVRGKSHKTMHIVL